jgi:hypothetical protein
MNKSRKKLIIMGIVAAALIAVVKGSLGSGLQFCDSQPSAVVVVE